MMLRSGLERPRLGRPCAVDDTGLVRSGTGLHETTLGVRLQYEGRAGGQTGTDEREVWTPEHFCVLFGNFDIFPRSTQ